MEHSTVFDLSRDADDPMAGSGGYNMADDLVAQQPIITYYCPARRNPKPYSTFYRCDYAGNAGEYGSGDHSAGVSRGTRGVLIMTDLNTIRIEHIRDGSTNTLMLGEKALHPRAHGTDGGDNERWNNAGWDTDVPRWGAYYTGVGIPPIHDDRAPEPPSWAPVSGLPFSFQQWHAYFGSSHPAGINACMADGAVRSFAFTIDADVFRRISLTDSGEPVSMN